MSRPAGFTHTPETRAKISATKVGNSAVPLERRARISATLTGRTLPPRSEQWCANISASLRGPRSYMWRGGITPVHAAARNTREQRAWRTSVFERDNWTCQLCGRRGGTLHADHIVPFATHPDLRLELTNGRTLCVPCHRKTPTYGGRIRLVPQSH